MNIDVFLVGDSYCFINEFVEVFYLVLGFGVFWCYFCVLKFNFICKFFDVVGVEWWFIISLNIFLYFMGSEYFFYFCIVVDLRNFLFGYLEYWLVMINMYLLLGSGWF